MIICRKYSRGWVLLVRLITCTNLFGVGLLFSQTSQEKTDFLYGERLYKEGLFDLAAIQFRNFLGDYPASPKAAEAQFLLAESSFSLNRFKEAQEEFLKLILRYPSTSFVDQAQFRIGECFEKMEKCEEAAESYLRVYRFYPESRWAGESLYRSGKLSMEMGNFVKGESTLRLLLGIAPTGEYRSKASFLLSRLYALEGEYERAVVTLEGLILRPIRESDRGEVHYRLGEIYEALGRWKESGDSYRKVIALADDENLLQKSWFRLGFLLKMEGEYGDAGNAFRKASELGDDKNLKARALFYLGRVKVKQNDFQNGLEVFESAERLSIRVEDRVASRFEKARCLQKLGRFPQAIDEYESILQDSSATVPILKKSSLSLACASLEIENPERAIDSYNRYLKWFEEDPLTSSVLLRQGRIYLQNLGLLDEGLHVLRRVWNEFPTSFIVPEARFVYAEGLEKAEDLGEALRVYRMILQRYPGTPWAEKAKQRSEEIEIYRPIDYPGAISKLTALVQKTLFDPADTRILFDLAMVALQDLKQYEEAIAYFKRYLSTHPESDGSVPALFHVGKSYELLSRKNRTPALLDSARTVYTKILSDYPRSSWAEEAGLRLAGLEFQISSELGYRRYRDLLRDYPNSEKRDEMLFWVSLTTTEQDSATHALTIFRELMENFPESPFFEEALYRVGKIRYGMGNFAEADSVFERYSHRFSEGRFRPEVSYLRVKGAERREDQGTAILLLENLIARFPCSVWADSGRVLLGELYLRTGAFSQAVSLYETALEEDSLRGWSASVGLEEPRVSERKIFLSGLARAYEGLRQYKKAKSCYFRYGREYRNSEDRVLVFSALAEIAEEEGMPTRAVDYLSSVVQEIPSDSTAEALGLLRLRLSQYEDAVVAFDQALGLTRSEEKRAYYSSRIIVALLRQGKIPQAEVRMNVFSQSFKKDPRIKEFRAEFALEKGKAYLKGKEFDSALGSFQEVVQKYKETDFVPQAELEIGRVYFITNKIEEALSILTDMARKYSDHPILAKVYLNLGDHYFRSKQYENALRAFKLAMEDDRSEDVVPVAMRYLIRVYDSVRMWDAALGLIREYIHRFPQAEDVLQKRVQVGNLYMKLNEYTRAVEMFREARKDADSETEAEIQYWIGKCFYSMGQFEQAIYEFLKVEYLSKPTKLPWNTTALYEAGQAYLKLRKSQQARKLFQKIVQKEGATSDLGRIARQRIDEIDAHDVGKE